MYTEIIRPILTKGPFSQNAHSHKMHILTKSHSQKRPILTNAFHKTDSNLAENPNRKSKLKKIESVQN